MASSRTLSVLAVACVVLGVVAASAPLQPLPLFHRGRPQGGFVNFPIRDRVGKHATSLPPNVKQLWIENDVDHFNPQNTATFMQRIFVNTQYWDPATGPMLLMQGGEAAQDPIWAVESDMVANAAHFNGMVVLLEHRFYGESQPFADLSTENLAFLTSEQALADAANVVETLQAMYKMTSANKVITFGGSYSGALSGWFRMKYPHITAAAVATSSPVEAKVDFFEYMEVVNGSLSYPLVGGSPQCVEKIAEASATMQKMLTTPAGLEALGKQFNVCGDLSTAGPMDIANFWQNVAGLFAGVVQYNLDNRAFEGATHTGTTVQTVCDIMTSGSDPVAAWASINNILTDNECTPFKYADMIMQMRNTSLASGAAEGGRQWTFQTCNEFGFYQTTDAPAGQQPFGNLLPLNFSVQQCIDIFGENYNGVNLQQRIDATLRNYGGTNFLATNVIVPNGNVDPWHTLSVLEPNPSYNVSTILIPGTGHCANMYPHRAQDSAPLLAARAQIRAQIAEWLKM